MQQQPAPDEADTDISAISNAANSNQNVKDIQTQFDSSGEADLSLDEKRKLRYDLLSLPPEKLGEIIFVLQKSQPQNIEQKGDELEIDLKRLNTRTLRHLQRYVESVFAKIRYSSMGQQPAAAPMQQQMFAPVPQQVMFPAPGVQPANGVNPWSAPNAAQSIHPNGSDIDSANRKRTFYAMLGSQHQIVGQNGGPQTRRKRAAFTSTQKEGMIDFWNSTNWEPSTDEEQLEKAAQKIGVDVVQLKVFRQNNRKKYTDREDSEIAQNDDSNENTDNSAQPQAKKAGAEAETE